MKVRPSVFLIEGEQPDGPWSPADKLLAMAWTILQRETCQECGQPLWICRSDNNNLTFGIKKGICYSKLAMENFRDDQEKKKVKPKNGETVFTIPKLIDESKPMPSRFDYLKQLENE